MKKIMFTLIALLAIAASARAMSYEQARNEALFLTDKMAYELNLTDAQYEAAYEINLDYLMTVTGRDDVYGLYWERRNMDLQFILHAWQWEAFRAAAYFFRPLYWDAGYWHFGIYARYPRRDYFYFGRPHFYASYRGGHSWRMNGGHSYYEPRRDHFRPAAPREQHVGMRDGWNRGDYRSAGRGGSSTRVTGPGAGGQHQPGNQPGASGNWRQGQDQNRSGGLGNGRTPASRSNVGSDSRTTTTPSAAQPSRGTTTPSRSTASPSRSVSAPLSSGSAAQTRSVTAQPSRSSASSARSVSGSRSSSGARSASGGRSTSGGARSGSRSGR